MLKKRVLTWAGVAGGFVMVGVSLGMMAAAHLQNRELSETIRGLSVQLEREKRVVRLAQVGPKDGDAKVANQDFCPVTLSICQDAVRDAQKQAETFEEGLTEKTKELVSAKKGLQQCKNDSWITLKVFRRLKEALGQSKQEDDSE